MVRIKNTAPEERRVRAVYVEEVMGEYYDPPGIVFDEQDGTVANAKQEVVDDLLDHFPEFERLDSGASDGDDDEESDDEEPDAESTE